MKKQKDGSYSIHIEWNTVDVLSQCENQNIPCTLEQAKSVLEMAENCHDACHGISWDTLDVYIDEIVKAA